MHESAWCCRIYFECKMFFEIMKNTNTIATETQPTNSHNTYTHTNICRHDHRHGHEHGHGYANTHTHILCAVHAKCYRMIGFCLCSLLAPSWSSTWNIIDGISGLTEKKRKILWERERAATTFIFQFQNVKWTLNLMQTQHFAIEAWAWKWYL